MNTQQRYHYIGAALLIALALTAWTQPARHPLKPRHS